MTHPLRPLCPPLRAPLAMSALLGGLLAPLAPGSALAQATSSAETGSRIARVQLYPGSATVERVARVAPGTRSISFRCLPQGLDAASLQVSADAAVRVGESSVQVQDRDIASGGAGGCASPLDERVREAQDQVAAARAETDALELAHSYLKTMAGNAPGPSPAGAPPTSISSTTETLRRSAQDTLQRLHQAKRRQEAAELSLKAISAERDRLAGPRARVSTVTVNLATEREAELRLTYQVRGPSWSPSYRASLDAATGQLRLERLALVAQSTGEDWNGVQLTLSTGQPTRATEGGLPRPWRLDVAQPMPAPAPAPMTGSAALARLAAPLAAAPMAETADAAPLPSFEVATQHTGYASEFAVPQRIQVASGGPRVTLSLGESTVRATLLTRVTPAIEAAGYLVAQLNLPEGVWPTAPVALYRDGSYVGQGSLDTAALARTGLAFGRDERVRVQAEPLRENTGSAGLTGSRTERVQQRAYSVENRYSAPLALQVLDAAPVSQNEQITVESRYEPAPSETQWNQQPGSVAWNQTLAPGATARFATAHTIRYPKELRLQERR